jgi:hypothetical protein
MRKPSLEAEADAEESGCGRDQMREGVRCGGTAEESDDDLYYDTESEVQMRRNDDDLYYDTESGGRCGGVKTMTASPRQKTKLDFISVSYPTEVPQEADKMRLRALAEAAPRRGQKNLRNNVQISGVLPQEESSYL